MTIMSHERKMQALTACDRIYEALCAEDMDGAFRASYIMKQIDDLHYILDPKGRGRKRYARRKRRLRITE